MPPSDARDRSQRVPIAIGITLLGAVVLLGLARTYWPFFSDDAFISLRYARRLLDGGGLTWTDGERVEGYSNLLWVLACAGLGGLGIDLVAAARALGIAGTTAAIAAVPWLLRPRSLAEAWPALAGALAIAVTMAAWSIGGLEQPLLSALFAWSVALWLRILSADEIMPRYVRAAGLLSALLCLTRPDAPLLVAALAGGVVAARGAGRATLHAIATYLALPVAAVLGQLLFRLLYYGDWVPNTAYVKVALAWQRVSLGTEYVAAAALWHLPLVAAVAVQLPVALADARARRGLILLSVPLAVWMAYLCVVGGDSFPAHRAWVPVTLVLALALATCLAAAAPHWIRSRLAPAALLVLLAAAQIIDPQARRAREERWEWEGEVVGRFLGRAFTHMRPLLATDPAGAVPYYSGLPALDMLGLSDRHVGRARPENFGAGMLGHEVGDGAHILSRRPDLVLFCTPAGSIAPCFRSGKLMALDPRFAESYIPVWFEGDAPFAFRSRIYVRHSGRIGVRRESGRVVVPGWLLASNPETVARFDPAGHLAMTATGDQPAALLGLPLDVGRWRLEADAGGMAVTARVSTAAAGALGEGEGTVEFTHAGGSIDVVLAPAARDTVRIRGVTLTRIAGDGPGRLPGSSPGGNSAASSRPG